MVIGNPRIKSRIAGSFVVCWVVLASHELIRGWLGVSWLAGSFVAYLPVDWILTISRMMLLLVPYILIDLV